EVSKFALCFFDIDSFGGLDVKLILKFLQLFFYFLPYLRLIFPIKANPFYFVLDAIGLDHCRQRSRDSRKNGAIALFQFKLFPVSFDIFFICDAYISVNMGMTTDEFLA